MFAEYLMASIGIGLFVNFTLYELLGLAAGGLVVPGYLALSLNQPLHVLHTFVLAGVAWGFVEIVSRYTILYGRRRIALYILTSFVLEAAMSYVRVPWMGDTSIAVRSVGYIIPGLIAIGFDRQGIVDTISTLCITTTATRLFLVMIYGWNILAW